MAQKKYKRTMCMMVALFLAGCVLGGCGGDGANANPARIAETFFIEGNSFLLRSDSDPEITVSDGATVYRMLSSGTVFFASLGIVAGDRTITLRANDLVIERPAVQTVTVVREGL